MFQSNNTVGHGKSNSLLPAPQLPQKQIGVMPRRVDVLQDGRAAYLAGVIDHHVAEPKHPLPDAGRNRYVLDFAQGNVARRAGNQTVINLQLGIGQRVPQHVSLQMIEGRDQ